MGSKGSRFVQFSKSDFIGGVFLTSGQAGAMSLTKGEDWWSVVKEWGRLVQWP